MAYFDEFAGNYYYNRLDLATFARMSGGIHANRPNANANDGLRRK